MDQRAAVGAASWCCSGVPRTVSWGLEVRFEPEAEVWYPAVLWTHYTSTSPPGEFCLHPQRADEGVCVWSVRVWFCWWFCSWSQCWWLLAVSCFLLWCCSSLHECQCCVAMSECCWVLLGHVGSCSVLLGHVFEFWAHQRHM